MAIKNFTPCSDWFFVQLETSTGKPINHRLAGWALFENNGDTSVVGLISIAGGGQNNSAMKECCKLVTVPPVEGVYKHVSEISST